MGYFSMKGDNVPQPLTPSMTPLSEVSGFAQHPTEVKNDEEGCSLKVSLITLTNRAYSVNNML